MDRFIRDRYMKELSLSLHSVIVIYGVVGSYAIPYHIHRDYQA